MNTSVAALLPMRHSSERVPGKNFRDFAGIPLFHQILNQLLACKGFSEIVIDTDSSQIMDDVSKNYPTVRLISRPQHLRDDKVPMNDVLLHDVKQIDADFFLQTHSTNPLLRAQTITKAIGKFLTRYPIYDSLFSVTPAQVRLWDGMARPINHNPNILLRTQDLAPVYEENSCIYIFQRETLELRRNRIGNRPLLYEIDAVEAWDIDEELDFQIAEFLYKSIYQSK